MKSIDVETLLRENPKLYKQLYVMFAIGMRGPFLMPYLYDLRYWLNKHDSRCMILLDRGSTIIKHRVLKADNTQHWTSKSFDYYKKDVWPRWARLVYGRQ